jgi:hypothetical protein
MKKFRESNGIEVVNVKQQKYDSANRHKAEEKECFPNEQT